MIATCFLIIQVPESAGTRIRVGAPVDVKGRPSIACST